MIGKNYVRGGLLAVFVAGIATILAWQFWVPNHRPALEAGQSYGIDVSHHQDNIDWQAVRADDIEFAYIKATEGGDWVDPRFDQNWRGASDTGVKVGAYHFFTLCTDGAKQAANFLEAIESLEASLPAAVDVELGGNCSNPPSNETVKQELNVFLEVLEDNTGEPTVVYVLEGFEFLSPEVFDRPRWDRSLFRQPAQPGWFVWQYSGRSKVDGIIGDTDLNVFSGAASN